MSDERRSVGEPFDRLTRICDRLVKALEADPEYDHDLMILMLDSAAEERGGMVMHGYESDMDATVALFEHLRAIFRVNGHELLIAPLGRG